MIGVGEIALGLLSEPLAPQRPTMSSQRMKRSVRLLKLVIRLAGLEILAWACGRETLKAEVEAEAWLCDWSWWTLLEASLWLTLTA